MVYKQLFTSTRCKSYSTTECLVGMPAAGRLEENFTYDLALERNHQLLLRRTGYGYLTWLPTMNFTGVETVAIPEPSVAMAAIE